MEYTLRYMEVLRRLGRDIPELDKSLCHIIASGMFNGIFEIVVHDMPREQALRDVDQLRRFLHRRMAEIDGGMTPIFFGYWLVNANYFDKEGLLMKQKKPSSLTAASWATRAGTRT